MAKIIVSLNGKVLEEVKLIRERTSIGRHARNDVVIDNRAISGDHAAIVMAGRDFVIEDMNSTNGTVVNAHPVKKHFLQDNDVIELAKYKIQFLTEARAPVIAVQPVSVAPASATVRPAPAAGPVVTIKNAYTQMSMQSVARAMPKSTIAQGSIKLLTGPNAGKQQALIKAITTIGRPGGQVAVITQHADGYYLAHVEGDAYPLVNGEEVQHEPRLLEDGDVIAIAGIRMGFSWAGKLVDRT